MKKNWHNEEEIVGILREEQGGNTAKAVCARHTISAQTLYNWKRKFGATAGEMNQVLLGRLRR